MTGCVAFAQHTGSARLIEELLPQCWEQVRDSYWSINANFHWFGKNILFWIFLICEKLTIKVFLPFEIFCYGYNCIKLLITSGSLAFTYHDANIFLFSLKFICPDKSQVPREKNPGGWGLWGAGILLTSQYLHHAYINILLSLIHHAMWIILPHWQGKKQVVISQCFFNTELIDLDETVLMGTSICWRHLFALKTEILNLYDRLISEGFLVVWFVFDILSLH